MTRWQALVQGYRATLKPREMEEIHDLLFCRPLAYGLAKALYPTRVTPDGVSLFTLLWSFVVAYCFWLGDYRSLLIGSAAYFFWNVLDCADGQLARLRGGGSPVGYLIDQVVDWLSTIALWVGIAHGLSVQRPGEHNWWLMAVLAGLSMGIQCGFLETKRHEWMARVYGTRRSFTEDLDHVTALADQWRAERTNLVGRFVVRFYQVQRLLQRTFTSRMQKQELTFSQQENERWAKHNRVVLRMAVWLGPTNHMFVAIICASLDRIDYYLWLVFFVGFPWMAITYLVAWYASYRMKHERLQEI